MLPHERLVHTMARFGLDIPVPPRPAPPHPQSDQQSNSLSSSPWLLSTSSCATVRPDSETRAPVSPLSDGALRGVLARRAQDAMLAPQVTTNAPPSVVLLPCCSSLRQRLSRAAGPRDGGQLWAEAAEPPAQGGGEMRLLTASESTLASGPGLDSEKRPLFLAPSPGAQRHHTSSYSTPTRLLVGWFADLGVPAGKQARGEAGSRV